MSKVSYIVAGLLGFIVALLLIDVAAGYLFLKLTGNYAAYPYPYTALYDYYTAYDDNKTRMFIYGSLAIPFAFLLAVGQRIYLLKKKQTSTDTPNLPQ